MLRKRVGAALTGFMVVAGMAFAVDSSPAHAQYTKDSAPYCNSGETQPMFRIYNRETGEHLFSADENERDILVNRGWVYEGVSWVSPIKSSTPVHRLYNSASGDHHYTTDPTEIDSLTKKHGWDDEGIGWYSDDCHTVDVYRQFNPRLRIGSHNYTTDLQEYEVNNTRNGWRPEGIAWYASEPGWALGADPTYVTMNVTVSDVDGSDSDTFTIPQTNGLQYRVGGEDIKAGTYKVKDYFTYKNHTATIEVTATVTKEGYRIKGGAAGSIYTKNVDDHKKVTTQAVTFSDKNGSGNDTFTVPNVAGVQYKAGNKNVNGGTYNVADYFPYGTNHVAHAVITAVAKDGYSLTGNTSWSQDIDGHTEVTPKAATFADKPGLDNDTFTIPSVPGVQYKAGSKNINAGTHKVKDYFTYNDYTANPIVTASPEDGYKFPANATTSWTQTIGGRTPVTPQAVTFSEKEGIDNDTFTVPNVTGVQYKAGGKDVAAGTYKVKDYFTYNNNVVNVTVTAAPKDGYRIPDNTTTSWSQTFDAYTHVTTKNVTFADKDGLDNDTFTIPSVTGVQYKAGSKNVAAGTYKVKDYFTYENYTVTAHITATPANNSYILDGTKEWSQKFDGYTSVATSNPTAKDGSGKKSDTYTIPNVTGVQYKANGTNVNAGTHNVASYNANGTATVTITAVAKAGYKLTGTTSWSFNYTADVFPEPVVFSDPNGSGSDKVTIPNAEGVYYTIDGVRKAPGTYTVPTQIGAYSNHHREVTVRAYPEEGYMLKSGSQLYYFHKFTDGQQATPPKATKSSAVYGNCTVAQAKAKSEQFHNNLIAEINSGSDYASRTSIGDIYGVTQDTANPPSTPTTVDNKVREINRRYALRYQELTNEFRAQCGLDTIQAANMTNDAESLAYAHAMATWNYNTPNIVGHYTDDPNLKALEARNNNGQGLDFDGTYGVAENLYFQRISNPNMTPEEIADRAFAGYISEYPYLDGTFNSQNGHLVNLLTDNYSVHANYMYVTFARDITGYRYVNGSWTPVYGTVMNLVSVQTPGATWYRE